MFKWKITLMYALVVVFATFSLQCSSGDDTMSGDDDSTGDDDNDGDDDDDDNDADSFVIETAVEGEGKIKLDPDQESYAMDDEVEIKAKPDDGWKFDHWSGDLEDEEDATVQVTVKGDMSVKAHFVECFEIAITTDGEGSVTKDPDEDCFLDGDTVELTAEPDADWNFSHWSGDATGEDASVEVTVEGNMEITAHFTQNYELTVNIEGNGSVTLDPDQEDFAPGTEVTLEAVPDSGWGFTGWQGDLTDITNPATLVMDSDKTVTAVFEEGSDKKTFTVTWVNDNLDPTDGEQMVSGLEDMGYENLGVTQNTSSSDLYDNYTNEAIGIQWHTGHGSQGSVATSDGSFTTNSLQDGEIVAQNVATATCLTLASDAWRNKMGPTNNAVMGYTDVTMDGNADITVGRMFRENIGPDHTMAWTWYQANTQYESDRWRIFFREGSDIADYNPSNIPDNKDPPVTDLTALNHKVTVATELLSDTRTFEDVFEPLATYHYAIAPQEKPISQVFRQGREFLAKTPMDEGAARAIADRFIGDDLPSGARIEYAIPVTAAVNGGPKIEVAYAIRYSRELDGLPIRANYWRHHYEVMVNGDQVAYTSLLWPEIRAEATSSPDVLDQILSVDQAIYLAADHIARLVKTPVTVVGMEPSYGNAANEIVPAYTLFTARGGRIVIDARTGAFLK